METIEKQLKQFEAAMPHDQLRIIYIEILRMKEQKNDLPPEITERTYGVTEAAKWVKMSASWLRKQVYAGKVKERKNEAGKWFFTWEDIQELIKIRNKKYL